MKKRIVAFLMMLLMLVSVVGCGEENSSVASDPQQTPAESTAPQTSVDTNEYINEDGTIKMPDLTNMPLEEARALLKSLGLRSKFGEEFDKTGEIDVGSVIKSDYEPGESVKKGTQVFLTVKKEGIFYDPDEPYVDPLVAAREELQQGANSDYKPLNYEIMKAVWISQFDLDGILETGTQRSEESLRQIFSALCKKLAEDGYNTVIVQVRPYGDSFYPSAYYPWSSYALGSYGLYSSYDPLKVMIEEAHKVNLSFQAWINPMRVFGDEKTFNFINVSYKTRQWFDDKEKYPNYIYKHETYHYLNVAYEEVRQLIIDGAAEIVRYYDVDGVHMDDYFYPTGIPREFDFEIFRESGFTSLKLFRMDNINKLVSGLYSAVKKENKNVLFGISPAGNLDNVRDQCNLDIDTILAHKGYVDYIMPQIYWGFEHDSQPYKTCMQKWQALIKEPSIKFIVGLTASNLVDPVGEFADSQDVFQRYLTHAQSTGMFDGLCVFSVMTIYDVMTATQVNNENIKDEMANFLPSFKAVKNEKIEY